MPQQQNGDRKSGLTERQKQQRAERQQEHRLRRYRGFLIGILLILIIILAYLVIKNLNGTWGEATDNGLDEADLGENLDDDANYDGPPVATLTFVGDISTSADQIRAVTQADGTYDFSEPFADIADYFSGYAVADFETNLVDGVEYGYDPTHNSPIELAGSLRTLGIRMVSTANTYALSNGIEGLTSTKNYLTQAKLQAVGTYLSEEERGTNGGAYICTYHKIKFAFLAYTKGTDSVTMPEGCEYALSTLYNDYSDYWSELDSAQIRKDVQAAKDAGAEVIIALVHWGSEYSRTVSDSQREAAQLLLENGVDVIIGTHSHLVSEMEFEEVELADGTTKTCFVAYGLGDFYTDPEQENAQQSMILNLEFTKGADGQVSITDAGYVPIYMHITEENGLRTFHILDVYKNLAELKRNEETLTAEDAELMNQLLDTVDTLHNYAGEDLDAGPADTDKRIVEQAVNDGEIPESEIQAMREAEAEQPESDESGGEDTAEDDETEGDGLPSEETTDEME